MLKLLLFLITYFYFFITSAFASTEVLKNNYITLKVIPEYKTITKSTKSLDLLLEITPKKDWHLYYKNPGDTGDKTELTSNDSLHHLLLAPLYSTPKKEIYEDIITSFVYHNTFYLKQTILLKNISSLKELNINFNLSYSACYDECIKEELFFDLNLPIKENLILNNDYITTYAIAEPSFPHTISAMSKISKNKLNLNLLETLEKDCSNPYFISNTPKTNPLSSLPTTKLISNNKLEITFDALETPTPNGLILCPNHTYLTNLSPVADSDNITSYSSLIFHILIAFLAGLILNLMPCVLPVLSLKALHLINSNQSRSYQQAISYMLGVICSFLTFAFILYYAKTLGKSLGWGFQLQSIEFNLFLLFLFFIIFLNLNGKIEFPASFTNFINKIPAQSSFLTGFFAVVVATPCTGPFMGTALGYALVSDTLNYFAIFLSLSIGYALPYTLIELNPKTFSKILPKSGAWMIYFKQFLSIPIGLTCLWLGWIIYSQLNLTTPKQEISWHPYNKSEIQNSLHNNQKVFINFTAKWCLVCLLNDKTTLSTKAFHDFVEKNNIKLYKADYTNKDENITKALKSYNRNSVPLYIYQKNLQTPPQILPQILRLKDLEKIF